MPAHEDKNDEMPESEIENQKTRPRSGNRPGDYDTHLRPEQEHKSSEPVTRERSGNRPGDYDTHLRSEHKSSEPVTRERSGNRPGDYDTHLRPEQQSTHSSASSSQESKKTHENAFFKKHQPEDEAPATPDVTNKHGL